MHTNNTIRCLCSALFCHKKSPFR